MTKLALAFSVGRVAVALPLAQDLVPKWLIFLVPGAVTGALIFGDWDSRFRIAAASVAGATLSAGIAGASQEGGESPAGIAWLLISVFYALASLASVAIAFGTVRALQHRGEE